LRQNEHKEDSSDSFSVVQQTHIDHAFIALHKSEKSDYIQSIEGRVLSKIVEAELASRCREVPMKMPAR
jgi:hypothetical protein